MKEYNSIQELLADEAFYKAIHIECTYDTSYIIFEEFKKVFYDEDTSYILNTDKGYPRETVKSYLRFFHNLSQGNTVFKDVLKRFSLEDIKHKRIRHCNLCELMRVNFARISFFSGRVCFIEDPLSNLDSKSLKIILEWMVEKSDEGVKFITTNSSMRHALLIPGPAFYADDTNYIEIEQDEESATSKEDDIEVYKISAKSGTSTLLFDPKDIDYIESMNKANYISVRNSLYQVSQTMDSLEAQLKQFGFFRCHRSYIVNVQKVEEIEKWTKNSYSLRLNNMQHSQIPLSKGRIEEMKTTFNW